MNNWKNELAALASNRIENVLGIKNVEVTDIRGVEDSIFVRETPQIRIVTVCNNRIFTASGSCMNQTIENLLSNITANA